VAVIDDNTRAKLFADGGDPIGQVVLLGSVPVRIIGVAAKKDSAFGNSDQLNVFVPYTTAMGRIINQAWLRSVTVRVADDASTAAAEQGIGQLMQQRHGRKDFFVLNTDSIRQTIESTTRTLTLLIASIAVISLFVGGIGVMNIMLVSVTERIREIGLRKALGATPSAIRRQFLIEASLLGVSGGVIGAAIGVVGAVVLPSMIDQPVSISAPAIAAALVVALGLGVGFGVYPASRAARLTPIDALRSE
jgi:macrolide transport system ATP-binding/permease protein